MLKLLESLQRLDAEAAIVRETSNEVRDRLQNIINREVNATERETAVRQAEVDAAARAADLDAREAAITKREAGQADLRNQLSIARASRDGAIEREAALAAKLKTLRVELNVANSELGTFKAAMQTIRPANVEAKA